MAISQEDLAKAAGFPRDYGATRLILFGSAARSREDANDLDLACDSVSGWRLYELGAKLEEELRIPLDLIPLTPLLVLPG